MTLTTLAIIVLMLCFNAVFAAYEIALASVSLGRLKALADQHRAGARIALAMKQSMESSLAVVQLGITLVGAIAAATGGAGAEESLAPHFEATFGLSAWQADLVALAIVVVPLSAVTIIVGELIPKVFAIKNKELVCLKISPLMRVLSLIFYPIVWVFEWIVTTLVAWTERRWTHTLSEHRAEVAEMQELRAIVALARTSRLIGGQEEKIILGAARLSVRPISEIMIPTEEMVTLDLGHTMAESLVLAHHDMHTRFPVCAEPGDPQTICGYVNFKDVVAELRLAPDQPSLRGIVRPLPDILGETSIAHALEQLIRVHVHIALVRDRHGRIIGMVTLEDILEELVGDILDEYDRAPAHLVPSGNGWVVGGGVPLERLEHSVGATIDRAGMPLDVRTLNDWVRYMLDRSPRGGDVVCASGIRVVVRKVRRQQVLEAQVSRDLSSSPPAGDRAHEAASAAQSNPAHDS